MKCRKGYKVMPLKCGAGWYIGTVDEDGFPNCRLTSSYAKSQREAYYLDLNRQFCMENSFCNNNCGCGINERRYLDVGNYVD